MFDCRQPTSHRLVKCASLTLSGVIALGFMGCGDDKTSPQATAKSENSPAMEAKGSNNPVIAPEVAAGNPELKQGGRQERIAAYQDAIRKGDYPEAQRIYSSIRDDRKNIPSNLTSAEKTKLRGDIDKNIDADQKFLTEWKRQFLDDKKKADENTRTEKEAGERREAERATELAKQKAGQEKAEQTRLEGEKKAEIAKAGGFRADDHNLSAASIRLKLQGLTTPTDLDADIKNIKSVGDGLYEIIVSLTKDESFAKSDFAAYDRLRLEYNDLISKRSTGSDIVARRISAVGKEEADRLLNEETTGRDHVLQTIMRVNLTAYGKFIKDLNAAPVSQSELSQGYKNTIWEIPFVHDPLDPMDPAILILRANGGKAPVILINPRLESSGELMLGCHFRTSTDGIQCIVRRLSGNDAKIAWETAKKIAGAGSVSAVDLFPSGPVNQVNRFWNL